VMIVHACRHINTHQNIHTRIHECVSTHAHIRTWHQERLDGYVVCRGHVRGAPSS
jgi:hypothetical protein